ncbi:hypothetical protein B0T13DRAFT_49321 [Neurospora crassa]|nr:hypothetical protein B0T13DRAFT_49321 [Neurospora crassa]
MTSDTVPPEQSFKQLREKAGEGPGERESFSTCTERENPASSIRSWAWRQQHTHVRTSSTAIQLGELEISRSYVGKAFLRLLLRHRFKSCPHNTASPRNLIRVSSLLSCLLSCLPRFRMINAQREIWRRMGMEVKKNPRVNVTDGFRDTNQAVMRKAQLKSALLSFKLTADELIAELVELIVCLHEAYPHKNTETWRFVTCQTLPESPFKAGNFTRDGFVAMTADLTLPVLRVL